MQVEIDIDKTAIVINDRHEVFDDGIELANGVLHSIKLIEIECMSLI